jgi:hypothetical protein
VLRSDYCILSIIIILIATRAFKCSLIDHLFLLDFFDFSVCDQFKRIFESENIQKSLILLSHVFAQNKVDVELEHQLFVDFSVELISAWFLVISIQKFLRFELQ